MVNRAPLTTCQKKKMQPSSPLVSCADGLLLHWCEREWAEQVEETKIHMLIQIFLEQIAVVL